LVVDDGGGVLGEYDSSVAGGLADIRGVVSGLSVGVAAGES